MSFDKMLLVRVAIIVELMKYTYYIFIVFLLMSCSKTDPNLYVRCFESIDFDYIDFSNYDKSSFTKNEFDSIAPCMKELKYREVGFYKANRHEDSLIVISIRRGEMIEYFPTTTRNNDVKTHKIERIKIKEHWYYTTYFW